MKKWLHKFVRRVMRWAQTPSEEEMMRHRRAALTRNLVPMLRKGEFAANMVGLSEDDARYLKTEALRIGAENGVDQTKVDGFIMEIEKYNPSIRKESA